MIRSSKKNVRVIADSRLFMSNEYSIFPPNACIFFTENQTPDNDSLSDGMSRDISCCRLAVPCFFFSCASHFRASNIQFIVAWFYFLFRDFLLCCCFLLFLLLVSSLSPLAPLIRLPVRWASRCDNVFTAVTRSLLAHLLAFVRLLARFCRLFVTVALGRRLSS